MVKYDISQGITQGLLSKFLNCRWMCRHFLKGISPTTPQSLALTYGSLGHAVLEQAYGDLATGKLKEIPSNEQIKTYTGKIEKLWHNENPKADKTSIERLELSLAIAESTLPVYFEYWKKDLKEIKWVALEKEFSIPYTFRDGTKTLLRGKLDGVYTLKDLRYRLFETKFKSRPDEANLVDALPLDLQVNFYIKIIKYLYHKVPSGLLYNVVRRTELRQKKEETLAQFAQRISEDIKSRPEEYFIRMELDISKHEIATFEVELDDLLEDFKAWWEGKVGHYRNSGECLTKYGRCNYLSLCSSGRMEGYVQRETLFRELEEK